MGIFSKITDAVSGFVSGNPLAAVGSVVTLADLFKGDRVPGAVSQAGGNISAIARALTNPDDPMFQRLAQEEEQTINSEFARALRDLGTYNRRMMARTGGLGILDPERRDEALASTYARSAADRKLAARQQARSYLSGALTANQAVAGAYAPMIAMDQSNREQRASGMQMLMDIGEKLFPPQQNFTFDFRDAGFQAKPLNFDSSMISSYTTPMNFR